jgi:hypothetical protein
VADVQILASGVTAAPLDYVIPGAQEILIKNLSATFNGAGAGTTWQPAITLLAPGGKEVGTFPVGSALAAGASADVAWFPRGGVNAAAVTPNVFGTSFIGSFGAVNQPIPLLPGAANLQLNEPPDTSQGTDLTVQAGGFAIEVNTDGWYSMWWAPTISGFDATSRGQVAFFIPSANIPDFGWWGAVGPAFPTLEIDGTVDSLLQDFTPSLIYSVPPVNFLAGETIVFAAQLAPTWVGTTPDLDSHSNVFVCRVA